MSYYDASNEFEFSMLAMVLGHLLEHASGYDVEIMLVGAAARDLLIRNATGAHRRLFTTRDAIDLRSILTAYSNGPHLEELYTEWEQVLSHYDFDPELAGAHRVGSEIRQTLGAAMADECCQIIGDEAEGNDRLAAEMAGTVRRNRLLLNATRAGAGAGL
jgi:predicted nucleotidyltransferase